MFHWQNVFDQEVQDAGCLDLFPALPGLFRKV